MSQGLQAASIVAWVVIVAFYLTMSLGEADKAYIKGQRLPLWTYPGIAAWGLLALTMVGGLLYLLAVPIIYWLGL